MKSPRICKPLSNVIAYQLSQAIDQGVKHRHSNAIVPGIISVDADRAIKIMHDRRGDFRNAIQKFSMYDLPDFFCTMSLIFLQILLVSVLQ